MFERIDAVDAQSEVFADLDRLTACNGMIGDVQRQVRVEGYVEFHDRTHGNRQNGLDGHFPLGEDHAAGHAQVENAVDFGIPRLACRRGAA